MSKDFARGSRTSCAIMRCDSRWWASRPISPGRRRADWTWLAGALKGVRDRATAAPSAADSVLLLTWPRASRMKSIEPVPTYILQAQDLAKQTGKQRRPQLIE